MATVSIIDWLIECEELPQDEKGRSYLSSREFMAEQYYGNGSAAGTDLPESATVVEEVSPRKTAAADRKTMDESPFHWSLRGLEVRLRNSGYEGDLSDYFGMTSKRAQQAAAMDPQQRILLEMSYEAMENAGWQRESYAGSSTAVYAAMFTTDFDRNLYKDTLDLPTYYITGTEKAIRKQASFYFCRVIRTPFSVTCV